MAEQIGGRQQIARKSVKPRREFLPEATAAAEATGEILTHRFGDQPWIFQIKDAIKNAVQNGIENLSGSVVTQNGAPGGSYQYPARSREELLATQHLVADARTLGKNEESQDPAVATPPPKADPEGWLL
jgi:hypothetical protein